MYSGYSTIIPEYKQHCSCYSTSLELLPPPADLCGGEETIDVYEIKFGEVISVTSTSCASTRCCCRTYRHTFKGQGEPQTFLAGA